MTWQRQGGQLTAQLPTGTLTLTAEREDQPTETLLQLGWRRNPKRSFLLVSTVLGKHIPTRGRDAQAVHQALARRLPDMRGAPHLIALAETATALGLGVADAYREQRGPCTAQITTRRHAPGTVAMRFEEPHSHATGHLIYTAPGQGSEDLILVDDEISSGQTLLNLALQAAQTWPALRRVHFVAIADWCPQRRQISERLAHAGLQVSFTSLLRGTLHFQPNGAPLPELPIPVYLPSPRPATTGEESGQLSEPPARRAPGDRPLLYLGTGEHQHAALRAAIRDDAHFSATTRSPAFTWGALRSALYFADPDGYGDAWLYNVEPLSWQIQLCARPDQDTTSLERALQGATRQITPPTMNALAAPC